MHIYVYKIDTYDGFPYSCTEIKLPFKALESEVLFYPVLLLENRRKRSKWAAARQGTEEAAGAGYQGERVALHGSGGGEPAVIPRHT